MYCSRCGQELPAKAVRCPVCDSPAKKRRRYKRRLFLGLVIFLAGAFTGSIFDSIVFEGHSWKHSIWNKLFSDIKTASHTVDINVSSTPEWEVVSSTQTLPPHTQKTTETKNAIIPPDVSDFKPGHSDAPSMAQLPNIDRITSASQTLSQASSAQIAPQTSDDHAASATLSSFSLDAAVIAAETKSATPAVNIASAPADFDLEPASLEELEDGESNNYHGSLWVDGDTLLFSSTRGSEKDKPIYQPYLRSLKSKAGAIRLFSWQGNVWTPEFSKDGKLLVFSSDSVEKEHVFVYDRITQQHRRLSDGKTKNMMPAISPDGKFIAFTSNRKGNNDIWLVSIDGGEAIQLTSGPEDDREPRWWPDGKHIVFTRILDKLKVSHIMKLAIDPLGKPKPLIAEKARSWLPDPSPNGKWLAYVRSESEDGSKNVIHIRRLDDKHEFTITAFGSADAFKPVWTPDSSGIICHADRAGHKVLYMVKFNKKPKK